MQLSNFFDEGSELHTVLIGYGGKNLRYAGLFDCEQMRFAESFSVKSRKYARNGRPDADSNIYKILSVILTLGS